MIENLSEEQEQDLIKHRDLYLSYGLSTQKGNHENAAQHIGDLYESNSFERPITVFLPSPYACNLAINLVNLGFCEPEDFHDSKKCQKLLDKAPQKLKGNKDVNFYAPVCCGNIESFWVSIHVFAKKIGVKYDDHLDKQIDIWNDICQNSHIFFAFEGLCFISDFPEEIHMVNGLLHKDGGAAVKYRDGWSLYSLNGVQVPEWIAVPNSEQLDPKRIKDIDNAQVRAEFVRKVGIDRLVYSLGAKVIDEQKVTLKTPHDDSWECHYQLLEVDYGNDTIRRCLKMPNASHELWHVEYVPVECNTVDDAINFRLNRTEDEVSEDGSPWYMHGDVIIKPKGAVKTKRWPELIA